MYLCYNNQKIELCCQDGFKNRLMGIMFKKDKLNKALYFKRCNSIHTFFMKSNIDVIMCDKNYKVLYFYKNLPKNRIILPKKNVYIVIETPSNYFNVKVHDIIKMEE